MNRITRSLFVLPALVLGCSAGLAQSTAQISGSVKDQTGAVLPGAEVTAVQIETGAVRTALVDEAGSYTLSNLATGPYRVEISLPGFKTYLRSGIVLQVNGNRVVHGVLEVGQVSDEIEVQANCAGDRRHVFNFTSVAEVPRFANATLRTLASGWRLSTIYRRQTGQYLTAITGTDRALTGFVNQRPNQVLENPYGDGSLNNYLNPAAFAQPASGTISGVGRNNIAGPAFWQFDVSLSRMFQTRERQRLELRAEAFNVTNSLRRGNPNLNFNNSTFGTITTAQDARVMQFAVKYVF